MINKSKYTTRQSKNSVLFLIVLLGVFLFICSLHILTALISAVIMYTLFRSLFLYFVTKNDLQLGIFQGTVACTNIAFGKGVCGTCYQKKDVIIVEDVNLFEGHIACSSLSQSEIVLPVFDDDKNIIAVFDVDSEHLAYFDKVDQIYLEKALKLITPFINQFLKSNYQ